MQQPKVLLFPRRSKVERTELVRRGLCAVIYEGPTAQVESARRLAQVSGQDVTEILGRFAQALGDSAKPPRGPRL